MDKVRDIEVANPDQVTHTEDDQKALEWVKKRYECMDEHRKTFHLKWDKNEKATRAKVPDSTDGKAQVNIPMEQILLEVYLGQQQSIQYSVRKEQGKIDQKYKMFYEIVFENVAEREEIWKEVRRFDRAKGTFGTGILYSGVWFETKRVYNGKADKFFDKEQATSKKNIWHIGLKSWDIRKAWFDESAVTYEECMDCIGQENLRYEDFKIRYADNEEVGVFKNVDTVGTMTDQENESPTKKQPSRNEIVKIWHYWNKIDGSYIIVANENIVIYNGVYTCKHGMLPLVPVQHYERLDSLYGDGIADRLETVRPYLNSILKVALDSSWLNASPGIITDDGIEIDGDIYLEAGALEEIKFSGDGSKIAQFQTNINIGQLVEVLKVMEDWGMITTGYNYRAPFTSPGKTAFEVNMMKEEQNSRMKPVLQSKYEGLAKAMTMMLVNVVDFVPYSYAEHVIDQNGSEDIEWYKIEVKDKRMKETEEGFELIEDEGFVDEIQLKPDLFLHGEGLKMEITTPYTTTITQALKRAEFQDYISQRVQLAQVYPDMPLGDPQEISDKLDEMYDLSIDDMTLQTRSDKNREKFATALDSVSQILSGLQQVQNAPTIAPQVQQEAGQGGGIPEAQPVQPTV